MPITPEDLSRVHGFQDLAKLFYDKLDWPTQEWQPNEAVSGVYGIQELESQGVESISLLNISQDQEWAIFLIDFGGKGMKRAVLKRDILSKIAQKARQADNLPRWKFDTILFIVRYCGNSFAFCWFTGDKAASAKLRTFGWSDPTEARTAIENLGKLEWGKDWSEAWNVEKLTKAFFSELSDLFYDTSDALAKVLPQENERRLFVQTLFNRLIFLRFVEKKGWLQLGDRKDYLRALWEAGQDPKHPFWPERLNALFNAVNLPGSDNVHAIAKPIIGDVPYLNGGLFDDDHRFVDPKVLIPAHMFEKLLGPQGLFYKYNFTVEESSPLDVQVAVDPEILGKIFEQLTISGKRHDTGSYYTPREIVQFMCREALVGYLGGKDIEEDKARKLVYDHDDTTLTNQEGNQAFEALKAIKVVDPACGSGAYLLGMLQELYALFEKLRRDDRKFSDDPAKEAHERKLWIIENNIYGVDLQAFATNTAMLRLWLTLLVEDTGERPQPLPNLEYKIETGDSLLGPDPSIPVTAQVTTQRKKYSKGVASGQQYDMDVERDDMIAQLRTLRETYQNSHADKKVEVKKDLEAKLAELREKVTGSPKKDPAKFDWRVEFFDVFLEDPEERQNPGFDAVVMNPPYVATYSRQSEQLENEPELRRKYGVYGGRINLFTCFIVRMHELLTAGGSGAFIVPDTFAASESYELVRKLLFTFRPRQTWILLRDSAFGATVRNVIVTVGPGPQAVTSILLDRADEIDEAVTSAPAPSLGGGRVSFFRDKTEQHIWDTVSGQLRTLEDLCIIRDGVNPGAKDTRAKLLDTQGAKDTRPLIEGTDIDSDGYRITWRGGLIRYAEGLVTAEEKKRGSSLRDPAVFQSPKLVSRQTADTLIFALDVDQSYVGLNSVHFSRAVDGDVKCLEALLMLMNSPLARLFYALDGGETRDVLPQVHIAWLRKFPIPEAWDRLMARLAPLGESVHRTGDLPVGALLQAHRAVCFAYGLEDREADVLEAFVRRYPRFAAAYGFEVGN